MRDNNNRDYRKDGYEQDKENIENLDKFKDFDSEGVYFPYLAEDHYFSEVNEIYTELNLTSKNVKQVNRQKISKTEINNNQYHENKCYHSERNQFKCQIQNSLIQNLNNSKFNSNNKILIINKNLENKEKKQKKSKSKKHDRLYGNDDKKFNNQKKEQDNKKSNTEINNIKFNTNNEKNDEEIDENFYFDYNNIELSFGGANTNETKYLSSK